jgi:hypothetical protein
MLDLRLRDEFLGSQMPNTAIALRRADNKGAAQQAPEQILDITYPTADEQWGLDGSTTLARTKIEFHSLSVQQIKQILQRLPSAFKATMEITYTEDQG